MGCGQSVNHEESTQPTLEQGERTERRAPNEILSRIDDSATNSDANSTQRSDSVKKVDFRLDETTLSRGTTSVRDSGGVVQKVTVVSRKDCVDSSESPPSFFCLEDQESTSEVDKLLEQEFASLNLLESQKLKAVLGRLAAREADELVDEELKALEAEVVRSLGSRQASQVRSPDSEEDQSYVDALVQQELESLDFKEAQILRALLLQSAHSLSGEGASNPPSLGNRCTPRDVRNPSVLQVESNGGGRYQLLSLVNSAAVMPAPSGHATNSVQPFESAIVAPATTDTTAHTGPSSAPPPKRSTDVTVTPLTVSEASESAAGPPFWPYSGTQAERDEISCVLPGQLFLTNWRGAARVAELAALGVRSVVCVNDQDNTEHLGRFEYLTISTLEDHEDHDARQHFQTVTTFTDRVLAAPGGGAVCFHCAAGISRSAAMAVAYLMTSRRLPLRAAFAAVYAARRVAWPNRAFMLQLIQYEADLRTAGRLPAAGEPSVTLEEWDAWTAYEPPQRPDPLRR